MTSEFRRGLVRVFSNYSRLGSTLAMGIIEVPILIAWLGKDAFGLISLLGPTIGLGAVVQDILTRSMVREMGQAHHSDDREYFRRIYNGCWVYSALAFPVSIALFTLVIVLLVPALNIEESLRTPAIVMAVCIAGFSCLTVLVTPTFNMYVVQERFAWQNAFLLGRRASLVIAAVVLFFVVGIKDPAEGLIAYAIVGQGLNTLQLAGAVLFQWIRSPDLRPRPTQTDRAALREIGSTFGWNSGVVATTNIADNLPLIFVNLYFGLSANAIYGLARRLASYARMITVGMTFGIDAVSARVSAGKDDVAMERLLRHSTRLNALVALPAAVAIFILVNPLIRLWLGRATDDPEYVVRGASIAQILVISTAIRGISEGWQRLLYGAGHVQRFAPLVIMANVGTPLLLWIAMETVPDSLQFHTPAIAYAALAIVLNLVLLPMLGARILGTSISAYLRPLVRPLLATAIASPVLVVGEILLTGHWRLIWLVLLGLGFGVVYAIATWFIVLDSSERARLRSVVLGLARRWPRTSDDSGA